MLLLLIVLTVKAARQGLSWGVLCHVETVKVQSVSRSVTTQAPLGNLKLTP